MPSVYPVSSLAQCLDSLRVRAMQRVRLVMRSLWLLDGGPGECARLHMRPVCEAPQYCKDDPASVYLGQSEHLLQNNAPVPDGFAAVRHYWKGRCSYAGSRHGASALCQILCQRVVSDTWRQRAASPCQHDRWEWVKNATVKNPGFICASSDSVPQTTSTSDAPAQASLLSSRTAVLVTGSLAAVRNKCPPAKITMAATRRVPCVQGHVSHDIVVLSFVAVV